MVMGTRKFGRIILVTFFGGVLHLLLRYCPIFFQNRFSDSFKFIIIVMKELNVSAMFWPSLKIPVGILEMDVFCFYFLA